MTTIVIRSISKKAKVGASMSSIEIFFSYADKDKELLGELEKHLTSIDIRSFPDLMRLAEEVKATQTPRVLKKADETVAILMPVGTATKPKRKRGKTKADYEAFKSAAGG